jgi:hypothetical protein
MTNNIKFSYFGARKGVSGSRQTQPTKEISLKQLIEVYNSEENKALSLDILNESNKDKQTQLKNKRAYYTPSGTFTTRKNEAITHHNNIISIDIDNLKNEAEAIEIKNKLSSHKSILFCCLSVRGKGVKALMLVNKTYSPEEQYQQLKNVFKPYLTEFLQIDSLHIDTAQFVLSQPCYFSYDANLYVNENAEELELNFNYKEAERTEFKKITVPSTATNRVEKYILSILSNKVNLLTPIGARHPKLFAAKGLGELIHYAPHLESEIINSFIEGGVAMYGKESMRNNVTDSVLKAFNGGKIQPINNSVIDSIIAEQTPTKQPSNNRVEELELNGKYLSDDKKVVRTILNTIDNNKFTIIDAPTGVGKTTFFAGLSDKFKMLFFVPLRTIAQQQKGDYPIILGETTEQEIELAKNYPLIFSTYASSHKIPSAKGKVLIIDESHLLSDRSNILYQDIAHLSKLMSQADKVIFLSATTNSLLKYAYPEAKQINIIKREAPKKVTPIFYDSKNSTQQDSVIEFIKNNPEGVNAIFFNDKEKLESIQNDVIKLGLLKYEEIAKFTSAPTDIENENYTSLVENEAIKKEIKLILATSKIGEGVNIKNNTQFNVLSVGGAAKDINFFRQQIGRFRGAEILNISVLFNVKFEERKGSCIDELKSFEAYKREVKSLSLNNELTPIEEDSFQASFDWNERAVITVKGYNQMLNNFELLHQVKGLKESSYNFDVWSKELSNYNIEFNTPITLGANKNKDLKEARAERKRERVEFLEEVRNNIIKYVPEVYRNTRNNKLKQFLYDDVNVEEVTLNSDELILFHSNFDKIEKYLFEIMTLYLLAEHSLTYCIDNYFSNDNYKNFNEIHKQITFLELERRGARTQSEEIKKHNIKRVKDAFKGVEWISKNDLIKTLRTKLNYNRPDVNNSALANQINGVFEVNYDKRTKFFRLKLVEKGGTFKSCFIYKPEKKKSNKELTRVGATE